MKKISRRSFLVATMSATVLAGCSSATSSSTSTATSTSTSTTTAATEDSFVGYDGVDNFRITEEDSAISIFFPYTGNGAPEGDMPIWQETGAITGMYMENVANESITDVQTSFNTMLVGDKLPDIIEGAADYVKPLITEGAFIPLDDLIAEYAPNIQQFLSDYPTAVSWGTGSDSQMYLIAGTYGVGVGETCLPSEGLFIRQDWLDNLGLDVPTTFDEYEDVMYAFCTGDPNGNGSKDEIAFFNRMSGTTIRGVLQFMGATHTWYFDEGDQMVYHGKTQEEYRDALIRLAGWYEDGVIDPELFTRGSNARTELLGLDIGGSTVDWFQSTGAIEETVQETVPGLQFKAIYPLEDINGKTHFDLVRDTISGYGWGISIDCEDPVSAIKFMDFFFSDVGSTLAAHGIEGTDYNVVDGEIIPTEMALSYESGYANYLRSIGSSEFGRLGSLAAEAYAMTDSAREGFEMYANSGVLTAPFPTLVYTEEESTLIADYWTNINTAITEYEEVCLLGTQDIASTWDAHIELLESMHVNEVHQAYTDAYNRYMAAL